MSRPTQSNPNVKAHSDAENSLKRKKSLEPETGHIDKRSKQDGISQEGFALHALEMNSSLQIDKGKVMSTLVEKIISNLSINRNGQIAEFNHNKPVLLTIPMIVKTENGVERKQFFYNSSLK